MKINFIKFPEDGESRIKKIISRSNTKPTGKYPSWKMGRMLHWENIEQLHAFRLLDINPAIDSFEELPMEIQYEMNGETYHEYPDILIKFGNSKEIWKIKKSLEVEDAISKEKDKYFQEQLLNRGFGWRLVSPESLIQEPRKQNAITLLRHGLNPISPIEKERIRNYLKQNGGICWGEIIAGLVGPSGPKNICRLVLEGNIYFEINQIWSSRTIFYWHDRAKEKYEWRNA